MRCAIEATGVVTVHADHLKGLRELARDHPRVKRRIVVSLDARPRPTEGGIEILPCREFADRLWQDELLG